MSALFPTLIVIPVVLPLTAAAMLLLIGNSRRRLRSMVNVAATLAGLVVAAMLVWSVDAAGESGTIGVYLAANWQSPFGIALVADRLSALMVLMVGIVSLGAALYAEAGWSRAGAYFHPLFQIQLMGLNGAFLTGDLFNLLVFFEVMLAASYGLQMHGSGWPRVRSGLHYIAVNLLASSLFLVGLAVIYGVMGTLSMADIAAKVALVPLHDRGLLHAGVAILAVAFLIKAAIWPLNAWLVPAYTATSVPVAALFVLMTKVGIYAVLRIWTLLFSADAGTSAHFGEPVLLVAGLATLGFGTAGLLGSIRLDRIAAFSIIVSSGTLLAALGFGSATVISAALFYLISATLAASALFLLVELVKRTSVEGQAQPRDMATLAEEDDNLDDQQLPLIGRVVPVSVAMLGLAYMTCALLVAGLPPLSGFIAKASLLVAVLQPQVVMSGTSDAQVSSATWMMIALVLISGMCATIALARAGIRHFWSKGGRFAPRLKAVEAAAVVFLIVAGLLLTVFARTRAALHDGHRRVSEPAAALHRQRAGDPGTPWADADRVAGDRKSMTFIRKIFPAPLLSAALLTLWILLARSSSTGQVLLGLAFALGIPILASNLRLTTVRVRRPAVVIRYVLTVCFDVLISNLAVAWGVIRWRWRQPSYRFVVIPLDLHDPVGLAALVMVTTIVPGTVWSELAVDRRAMMLHVWDAPDEDAFVARYKARYEQPLREIFE